MEIFKSVAAVGRWIDNSIATVFWHPNFDGSGTRESSVHNTQEVGRGNALGPVKPYWLIVKSVSSWASDSTIAIS
ncbi:MAG: hypothetical protein ACYC7D_03160 [Nitrososphaerales archaeon]